MMSDMENNPARRPNVLCFSGLDPSGGAGIQADLEALFSAGCHSLPVITALTVQDTNNAISSEPCSATMIVEQARALFDDMPVDAIKIGLAGDPGTIEVIHTLLTEHPEIPVVLDPVLVAGGGFDFGSKTMAGALRSLLLPLATVTTPNADELRQLAPLSDSLDACATELLDHGCGYVLATGGHLEDEEQVINRLYCDHQPARQYAWPRLPHAFHGSGCTLASSLAGYLAHGFSVPEAVRQAQQFTWQALEAGWQPGRGQWVPDRGFWHNAGS